LLAKSLCSMTYVVNSGFEFKGSSSRLRGAVGFRLAIVRCRKRPSDAEKIATETTAEFKREQSTADEAAAEEVEARSLLVQGKLSEAEAAIGRATALSRHTANLPLGFDISITTARVSVAGKKPPNVLSAEKAEKNLELSLALARKCGYLEYEYKIGLAIGEVELKSGKTREGRSRLEALADAAKARGFGLVAHQATAALDRESLQPHLTSRNFPGLCELLVKASSNLLRITSSRCS